MIRGAHAHGFYAYAHVQCPCSWTQVSAADWDAWANVSRTEKMMAALVEDGSAAADRALRAVKGARAEDTELDTTIFGPWSAP